MDSYQIDLNQPEGPAVILGLQLIASALKSTGHLNPTLVCLSGEGEQLVTKWRLDLGELVANLPEAQSYITSMAQKLVSEEGCDLSRIGIPLKDCKASMSLIVAQGTATMTGETFKMASIEIWTAASRKLVILEIAKDSPEPELRIRSFGDVASAQGGSMPTIQ